MHEEIVVKTCSFCGSTPVFELGKRENCQLHGEPYQPMIIKCKNHQCFVKPSTTGGDIFNGGETEARKQVAKQWNKRTACATNLH
jgi:hypothetical protein